MVEKESLCTFFVTLTSHTDHSEILKSKILRGGKKERDIVCQDNSHIMYEFNVNRNIFEDISAMLNLTVHLHIIYFIPCNIYNI